MVSPDVTLEWKVTFRMPAPNAADARLIGSDIPDFDQGAEMRKRTNDVWAATLGPWNTGSQHYNFNLGSVSAIDPHSPSRGE